MLIAGKSTFQRIESSVEEKVFPSSSLTSAVAAGPADVQSPHVGAKVPRSVPFMLQLQMAIWEK